MRESQLLLGGGLNGYVAAIRRILDGERDEEVLGEGLNLESWLIIHAILQGIEDPASLQALLTDSQ